MAPRALPRVALVWSQFAAYHVDRCEAVGQRLAGRAEVLAVELAPASRTYEWQPSGPVAAARKLTLFPGAVVEDLPYARRFFALLRVLWGCKAVFFGIGYHAPDIIVLSWVLRLRGVQVVMMTDSKFDDKDRKAGFELFKALLLLPYTAAIVAGKRQMAYARLLGFVRRPVLPGYDGVGLDRIRQEAGQPPAPGGPAFAERHFLYVGRFVEKKNLERLIEGYAAYAQAAGPGARRLRLAGAGPLEERLRQRVSVLNLAEQVDFLGFQSSEAVSRLLGEALALVLVSRVEQWGQVVNEALALGLPAIVSNPVGARDLLVRNLVNGFTVSSDSTEEIAAALGEIAGDEARWRAMAEASCVRAWLGDCARLADAVELLLYPRSESAASAMGRLTAGLD